MIADLDRVTRPEAALTHRVVSRCLDLLGQLIYIRLGVVPIYVQEFDEAMNKFIDELPERSAARMLLHHIYRSKEGEAAEKLVVAQQLYWCARWYGLGCPAVTLEGKLAAALMATETPADVIDDVTPPWDCFIVRLPMDFVELAGLKFTHVVVHRHIVTFSMDWMKQMPQGFDEALIDATRERMLDYLYKKTGLVWGLYAMTPNGNTLLSRADFPPVLLGKEQPVFLFDDVAHSETVDDRIIMALARLVVGISQMAETPNALRRKSTKKQQHRRWRFSKMPQTMEYVLAPEVPVKFDCTEAVGAYLRGDRKGPPRIQYVVRGHWRNQAHGPGRMARKRIWIQPHWKGPEDAPRLFREHRLEGKDDERG